MGVSCGLGWGDFHNGDGHKAHVGGHLPKVRRIVTFACGRTILTVSHSHFVCCTLCQVAGWGVTVTWHVSGRAVQQTLHVVKG